MLPTVWRQLTTLGTNSPRIAFATPSVVTRLISKFIRKNFSIILTLSMEIPIAPLACHKTLTDLGDVNGVFLRTAPNGS